MIQDIQNSPMRTKSFGAIVAYTILILAAYKLIPLATSVQDAFIIGFILYGVYDSTNYATIDNYKAHIAIADAIWGGVLFALIKYFI
jgi:uncharacterized membrane protein